MRLPLEREFHEESNEGIDVVSEGSVRLFLESWKLEFIQFSVVIVCIGHLERLTIIQMFRALLVKFWILS